MFSTFLISLLGNRVPKVNAKNCQAILALTWQHKPIKCHFTPSPPPPGNEKLTFLDRSWNQNFRFPKCHFTPPPRKFKIGIFGQIWISGVQICKVPLPPPPLKMQIWHFWTDLDFRSLDLQSATLTPPPENTNLVFLDRSGLQKFRFEKCHFTPYPENTNLSFLDRSWFQEFRFEKCHFTPPLPEETCIPRGCLSFEWL